VAVQDAQDVKTVIGIDEILGSSLVDFGHGARIVDAQFVTIQTRVVGGSLL
jgi:hypothetical protein